MPIYEYECDHCGHRFEKLVSTRSRRAACPSCGQGRGRRLISTFAAHGGGSDVPCQSGACPGGARAPAESCASGQCPFS